MPAAPVSDAQLLQQVREYIEYEPSEAARSHLHSLLQSNDTPALRSLFVPRISFGTAGLRAAMLPGYHNINSVVVLQTTQGLIRYLQSALPELLPSKGVVVGYDGRHNSRDWAHLTAAVFLSQRIPVRLFSQHCPTPLVPFAIRHYGLAAGVMITASHNPAADNGYKLYWSNSAQIIPPHDAHIQACIEQQLKPWQQYQLNEQDELLSDPLDEVMETYTRLVGEKYCWRREHNKRTKLRATYTAMHGVGAPWAAKAFEAFGLPAFIPVPEQIAPDPDFPTVAFPNPEEGAGALALSFRTADAHSSPLIIANDPDADRLAIAEKDLRTGEWVCLNGNQIAFLFADYVWQRYAATHPPDTYARAFMLNSTVSSSEVKLMAQREGFTHFDTLTGFKWMGNMIDAMVRERGLEFLFAFEVEIGYLIGDISLDKDGVRTAAVFYELAAQLYDERGITLMQRLNELYERYGYSAMLNKYYFCYSADTFAAIFNRIRTLQNNAYPSAIGAYTVQSVRDIPLGIDTAQADGKSLLPMVTDSFMLTLRFDGGSSVTLRNSGTEPKLKYYVECVGASKEEARRKCDELAAAVLPELLQPELNGLVKAGAK